MYNPFKDWQFYAVVGVASIFIVGGIFLWEEEKLAVLWGGILLIFLVVCLFAYRAKEKKNLDKQAEQAKKDLP